MSFERASPRMPLLLRVIMNVGAVGGSLTAIFALGAFYLAQASPAPFRVVNGAVVSKAEFMALAVTRLGSLIVFGTVAVILSWALRNRRRWSRPLLLSLVAVMTVYSWGVALAAGADTSRAAPGVIGSVVVVVVLWWQLYHDDDMLAYYEAIREDGA